MKYFNLSTGQETQQDNGKIDRNASFKKNGDSSN